MDIQQQILDLLDEIENEQKIKIILAIESGSRSWGFPSKDSDYDIRFIYHHEKDWYLSAFQKRDVVDTVFIGDLDAGGWDITKCMQLLNKGNGPLLEWLHSPIVYRQDEAKVVMLRKLAEISFNPKMIFHHYLSLAKKKLLDEKTSVSAKSYLYALRALLCARWVAEDKEVPPVEFEKLQQRYMASGIECDHLLKLISDKTSLSEAEEYKITDELMLFANDQLADLSTQEVAASKVSCTELYDETLRTILSM